MPILGIIASSLASAYPSGKAHIWYDAADTSSISVSGTAVTQWNDKGSAGLNLTQGTAANRPTSGVTTLNGNNVITFDGGDVLLNATVASWKFLHDGTQYVLGMVVKATNVADANNDTQVFSNIRRAQADVAGRNLQAESRSTTVDRLRVYVSNGSDYVVSQDSADNVWDQDNPVVYTELCDPDNATALNRIYSYFGNGAAIQTNAQTAAISTANPTYSMGIGATDNLANTGVTGYIAELVILQAPYNTATDRTDLRDYLMTKWGL